MSDEHDDHEDADDSGDGSTKPSAPKGLRTALTAAQQRVSDLEAENKTLKLEHRKRSVAEALEAHGAKPRIAKFYDGEGTSSDDVLAWLKENGEDFGWSEDEADDDDDDDTKEEARRIRRASDIAPQKPIRGALTTATIASGEYAELRKQGLVL